MRLNNNKTDGRKLNHRGISSGDKSLEEVHASVKTQYPNPMKRIFAFAGPAFLVSGGYMDPGNWAMDLEGGSC